MRERVSELAPPPQDTIADMEDARFWLSVVGTITASLAIIGAVVAISRWTGRVDTRLENLETAAKTVAKDIKKILRLWQPEVVGASPLQLTELGDRMAAFMKAQDWAAGIAPNLLPQVVDKQPFEIDQVARDHVASKLDASMERLVAACAYEFGRKPTGVRNVLHVVLRDELLRLRNAT